MTKEEAKERIAALIEKYEKELKDGKVKDYSEADTKNVFIEPLFEALGWNVRDRDQVSMEESISGQRVDYGFSLNGRTKFYLEAKPLKADLYREEYAKQATRYSFNKVVTWAVLTDFENLKVFNAQDISKNLSEKQYFDIHYSEYLKRFDQLWLLSREAFETDKIDEEAERIGKKLQKVSVTDTLYKDLNRSREMLLQAISEWNKDVSDDLLEEGVQKLLDRLVFIRVAEDRGIEPSILKQLIRDWHNAPLDTGLYESMISKFRELDAIYNSNLFSPHTFESWDEHSDATEKVINILYGKTGYYEYDFSVIPADILGGIYENYLGYQLAQSQKGIAVSKDSKKRKEQGIYYTPAYIVDYIVKNALKPILDRCKSVAELKTVKVLDPACGSGSFLIKALELLTDKYKEFGYADDENTKVMILLENLYGVDLDEKAVEIARLNLLVNSLSQRMKLPGLDKNIKNGNSLISGTDEELTKLFGKNYRDKKPFNWHEEFPEVFDRENPGFDVIIGNPPYIKEFISKSAFDGLHDSPYYQGKMDIWTMFACVAIDLLKNGGTMSFIAPNNWVTNAGASIFRDKALKEGELRTFVDFGDYKVFQQAGIQTMVYVFEKQKPKDKYSVAYFRVNNSRVDEAQLATDIMNKTDKVEIEPGKLLGKNIIFSTPELDNIFDKLVSSKNFVLTDKEVGQGIVAPQESVIKSHLSIIPEVPVGKGIFVLNDKEVETLDLSKEEKEILKPYYTSAEINRYSVQSKNRHWIIYTTSNLVKEIDRYPRIKQHLEKFKGVITSSFGPFGLHRAREEKLFIGPSIFSIRKTDRPRFSYVNFPCYVSQTYFVINTNRCNLKYLAGLLNSKLINFWLHGQGKLQGDMLQIDKEPLLNIPIHISKGLHQKNVASCVDKMLDLNNRLSLIDENSNGGRRLKDEINKTDTQIDQLVYKIYDLNPEEINIIEQSVQKSSSKTGII
jgi:adenine-specific DNA-methyltransferase